MFSLLCFGLSLFFSWFLGLDVKISGLVFAVVPFVSQKMLFLVEYSVGDCLCCGTGSLFWGLEVRFFLDFQRVVMFSYCLKYLFEERLVL